MLIYVPLNQIDDNPFQKRSDYGDIEDLAARIAAAYDNYPGMCTTGGRRARSSVLNGSRPGRSAPKRPPPLPSWWRRWNGRSATLSRSWQMLPKERILSKDTRTRPDVLRCFIMCVCIMSPHKTPPGWRTGTASLAWTGCRSAVTSHACRRRAAARAWRTTSTCRVCVMANCIGWLRPWRGAQASRTRWPWPTCARRGCRWWQLTYMWLMSAMKRLSCDGRFSRLYWIDCSVASSPRPETLCLTNPNGRVMRTVAPI